MCHSFHRKTNGVSFVLFLLLAITFIVFIYEFHHHQLSSNIADWGSFGSYVGGSVGILSVLLLYFTYNNQVKANRKSQFETILFQMTDCFKERFTEKKEDWDTAYKSIENYYAFGDLPDAKLINKKNVMKAIEYSYYNNIVNLNVNRQIDIFCSIIDYIDREDLLDESDKETYFTYLSSQISNEMLIIIMLGLIARNNSHEIEVLKKGSFFKNVDMGGNGVLNRIRQLYFSINANEVFINSHDDSEENLQFASEKLPETFMEYYSKFIANWI